jgi:hypothetical protein
MGHFAKVRDGIVINTMVAEPDFFDTFVDPDGPGEWIQTSYNTRMNMHWDPVTGLPSADQSKALRGNYAGIGMIYDRENDVFYQKCPHNGWILDETTWTWIAPFPHPVSTVTDITSPLAHVAYLWDDDLVDWREIPVTSGTAVGLPPN